MYLYTHRVGVITTPETFNAFQLSTKAEVPSFGLSPCTFKNKHTKKFHSNIMGF